MFCDSYCDALWQIVPVKEHGCVSFFLYLKKGVIFNISKYYKILVA
jgi:hypothetical protein